MKIGILCATLTEGKNVLQKIKIGNTRQIAKTDFIEGFYQDYLIVFALCGVGKTSSAICAQILIDHYNINFLVLCGSAKSLSKNTKVGDVIIGEKFICDELQKNSHGVDASSSSCNKDVMEKVAQNLIDQNKIDEKKTFDIFTGTIVTSDGSVASKLLSWNMQRKWGVSCVDMESVSVAYTCWLNKMPFLVIKGISGLASWLSFEQIQGNIERALENATQIMEKALPIIQKDFLRE